MGKYSYLDTVAQTEEYSATGFDFAQAADATANFTVGAVTSGILGMYNTGVALGESIGIADPSSRIDTYQYLKDQGWNDTAKYYQANQDVIDTVGFIGTSFVPGTWGVKAARALQAGRLTQGAEVATGLSRGFAGRYIAQAESIIANDSTYAAAYSLKSRIAVGTFAQAAYENAAFTTAVLATSNQNPTLNKDQLGYFQSLWANKGEYYSGMSLGVTALSGAIGTVSAFGKLNKLIREDSIARAPSQMTRQLGSIGAVEGDQLVYKADQLKKNYLQMESGNLKGRDAADLLTGIDRYKTEIGIHLAKLAGDEPAVIAASKKLITLNSSKEVDEVINSLQGVTGVKKLTFADAPIGNPRAYDVAIGDDEALRAWGRYSNSEDVSHILGAANMITGNIFLKVAAQWKNATGVTPEEAMFRTFLHEAGHLDTRAMLNSVNEAGGFMQQTMDQLEQISRIQRGRTSGIWNSYDNLVTKAATESDPLKLASINTELGNLADYLFKPTELLADAVAFFKDRDLGILAPKLNKQFNDIYQQLKSANALGDAFGPTHYIYDSLTGRKSVYKTTPQLGDLYKLDVDTKNGNLLLKGAASIKVKPGEFNPLEMTTAEADGAFAYWELASRKGELDLLSVPIRENDVPQLQAAINQAKREMATMSDSAAYQRTVKFQLQDGQLIELSPSAAEQELLKEKAHWAQRLGEDAQGIDGHLTWDDVQRRLNVDEDWAIHKGMGQYSSGNANIYGTQSPDAIRHVKIELTRNAALDMNQARDIKSVQDRVNARVVAAQAAAHAQLGEDFQFFHELKAGNLNYQDGKSVITDVSHVPTNQSFLGSANADPGTFAAKAQAAGKALDVRMKQKAADLKSDFAAAAYGVLNKPEALAEFNVFHATKARQFWYEVGSTSEEAIQEADFVRQAVADWVMQTHGTKQYMADSDMLEKLGKYANKVADGSMAQADFDAAMNKLLEGADAIVPIEHAETMDIIKHMIQINDSQVSSAIRFATVEGRSTTMRSGVYYAPPRDVRNAPYVAFVKRPEAEGMNRIEAIGALTAHTPAELDSKIATIKNQMPDALVLRKDEMADYHKTLGEYEAQKDLLEARMDSSMRRMGVLNELQPRSDSLYLEEALNHFTNKQRSLDRQAVKTLFANEVAELAARSKYESATATSQFGFNVFKRKQQAADPWEGTINTLLNISNYNAKDSAWKSISEKLDDIFSNAYHTVAGMLPAKPNPQTFENINKYMESMGMQPAYKSAADLLLADTPVQRQMLQPFVTKVNAVLGKLMVGIDTMNAITNVVSLPVLMGPEMKALRENFQSGALKDLTTVQIPGGTANMKVPSTMKLLSNAVKNFTEYRFTDKFSPELKGLYDRLGLSGKAINIVNELLEGAALPGKEFSQGKIAEMGKFIDDKILDPLSKLSGTQISEEFVRFIAGDVARQMVQAAGVHKEQWAPIINSFVTRVHGARIASQKPLAFQGVVGQAIGLFQTYQFNLIQQLFKNVANGDTGYAKLMLAMQGTIFGMQGLPGFHALNQAIGERNRNNTDIISTTYDAVGRQAGDWLVYGLASNMFHLDLYNRGDINPRSPVLLPTNFADIPAVSITTKAITNAWNTATQLSNGGAFGTTLLEGIAHNSVNRPLAGLATALLGYRTTNKGNLLMVQDSQNIESQWWSNAAALMGGKTIDEGIISDTLYRKTAYDTARMADLQTLGASVKTKIRAGQEISANDMLGFMGAYQRKGGNVEQFNKWMVNAMKDANATQIDQIRTHMNSAAARTMMDIIGTERSAQYRLIPQADLTEASAQ